MNDFYRLTFEVVSTRHLALYSDADPYLYSNTQQVVPSSQIPDEHWHKVSRDTSDPWSQYNQLKKWSDADTGFVRNIVLERATSTPTWEKVEEEAT